MKPILLLKSEAWCFNCDRSYHSVWKKCPVCWLKDDTFNSKRLRSKSKTLFRKELLLDIEEE